MKTNVAARFLLLINKHFKENGLGKYFNRSTIKVSYSCLPNLDTIIACHNKKVLKRKIEEKPGGKNVIAEQEKLIVL